MGDSLKNEATHTPGPWRLWVSVNDNDNNAGAFILRGDSPEPHGADMVIAKRDIGTPNGAEGVANARLIAAAPDLADAVRGFLAQWEVVRPHIDGAFMLMHVHGGNYRGPNLIAVLDALKAAIAKAEGR